MDVTLMTKHWNADGGVPDYVNPLNYVCRHGHAERLNEMLGFFKAEGVAQGLLHWAIERTRTEIVEILLSTGHVDPN